MKIKSDYINPKKAKGEFKKIFNWLDWMEKKKKLPGTLAAFIDLAKNPTHDNVTKTYFGLLRLKPWRRIVFETKQSTGAYWFLKLMREVIGNTSSWAIGEWKKLDLDYDENSEEVQALVPTGAQTGDDVPSDGTSPQKGDTPPV